MEEARKYEFKYEWYKYIIDTECSMSWKIPQPKITTEECIEQMKDFLEIDEEYLAIQQQIIELTVSYRECKCNNQPCNCNKDVRGYLYKNPFKLRMQQIMENPNKYSDRFIRYIYY